YTITPSSGANCVGSSFTITVPIRPEPVGMDDAATVCSDVAIDYNLINNVAILGNNVGGTFSWVATSNPDVTGESITPQSGGKITNVLNNVTNTPHTIDYLVTPTSVAGCVGNQFTVSITINPEPVGVDESIVICSETTVGFDLQNNVNAIGNNLPAIFDWSAAPHADISGEGTLVKRASIIDDVLTNNTNLVQRAVYTIQPSAQGTGCVGDP